MLQLDQIEVNTIRNADENEFNIRVSLYYKYETKLKRIQKFFELEQNIFQFRIGQKPRQL